jgi:hypothetical protein
MWEDTLGKSSVPTYVLEQIVSTPQFHLWNHFRSRIPAAKLLNERTFPRTTEYDILSVRSHRRCFQF